MSNFKLANINGLYRPNLLINGDFQVWQRGTSFTAGGIADQVYMADRWSTWAGFTCEKINNGIHINGDTYDKSLTQALERKLKVGETYTISAKINGTIYSKTFNGGSYEEDGFWTYVAWGDEWERIGINILTGGSYDIEWIKLEQGSFATPFIPRLYAEELALCKRFYEMVMQISTIGTMQWGNIIYFFIYVTEKRATPTVKISAGTSGNFGMLYGASQYDIPTYNIYFEKGDSRKLMGFYININGISLSGFEAGKTVNFNVNGDAFLEFDSEIH